MKTAESEILIKLDQFIRKYYKNRLIRGLVWSTGLISLLFLAFIIPESMFYFSIAVRTTLFFLFSGLLLFVLIRLIVIPLLQLYRIGRIISDEQAAVIIGKHFPEIRDKLLNTLQLIRSSGSADENRCLLEAGIRQKTENLKVFRFEKAIDLRRNRRYLKIAVVPVTILLVLALWTPDTISDPTRRILHFNTHYSKPLPYTVEILNREMQVFQQQDFDLFVQVRGEDIPSEIFVKVDNTPFRMARTKGFNYHYLFKSLQRDMEIRIVAGDLVTDKVLIKVLPKPIILNFDVSLDYPDYTGKRNEILENQGDLVIPEGTVVKWNFYTKDADRVKLTADPAFPFKYEKNGNRYSYALAAGNNLTYTVKPENSFSRAADSMRFNLMVVRDGFPSIFVAEAVDSATLNNLYFRGTIKDDYGFSGLTFNYSVRDKDAEGEPLFVAEEITIHRDQNQQIFYYAINPAGYLPEPGKVMDYYFEVKDNDGINGPKAARSEMRSLLTPDMAELAQSARDRAEKSEKDLEQTIHSAASMRKNAEELAKKLVEQDKMSWQEKKKLEDFIREAGEIEKRVEEIKQRNKENIEDQERFLETSERILEKQRELNELMDQLFSEELKKMIDELKQMMNLMDKEKLNGMMEKMKMSAKALEKELDRNLELMKQIEFDRKLEENISNLREAADKLDTLANKSETRDSFMEQVLEDQKALQQVIDSIYKETAELQKEAKSLEDPMSLEDPGSSKKEVDQQLKESENALQKKDGKGASKSMKKAGNEMRRLAGGMESANEGSEEEQNEEDAENLRMILENLIRLSFLQEDLIQRTGKLNRADPKQHEVVLLQKDFIMKMKVIEDSLTELAKRQLAVKPVILREIGSITANIDVALDQFTNRNFGSAMVRQQFAMTSINNLALLLNEALQQMKEQMANSMQSKGGKKSCSNPSPGKSGKKSAKDLKDLQGKIGEQLKKMRERMEAGQKSGDGKQQMKGMSKEVAKLAAQQEALRNEMRKYQESLGDKGIKNNSGLSDAMREMEQIERDLVNKRISQETINRQQRIMTRLLESEKAEQEREKEEKRESVEAKNSKISNLTQKFEYKGKNRASYDQLKLELPGLHRYYVGKVNAYFVKIEEDGDKN